MQQNHLLLLITTQSPSSKDLEHTIETQKIIIEQKDKELDLKDREIFVLKQ